MLRILDRYIIRKFLTILFFASMGFVVLFIIIDLIEHLDRFIESHTSVWRTLVYYLYYIPYIVLLTLPVNMLLSSLFSLGTMAQHNELVSCLSAGISLLRITLPILLMALLFSLLTGLASETIVPDINRARIDIYRYEIRNQPRQALGTEQKISIQDINQRQLNIQHFNGFKQRATGVNLIHKVGDSIVERLDAKYMVWRPANNSWTMRQVVKRSFSDSGEVISRFDSLAYGETQVFPEDLLDLEIKPEEMKYVELRDFVKRLERMGADARKWQVDLHMKLAYPFANFIIVLFGAPLASRKRRSGPALGFALALLISFVYFVFVRTGQVMGYSGTLSPWMGAWIGNIIFGIGGTLMMLRVRK